jgi:Pectate lyase superfamily protein
MQMASFRDSAGSDPQSFAGPRPYIDVTAYGCKGDASTDDTTCIRTAISAACAYKAGGIGIHPIIIFPPGYYIVAQPQTPSTAPVFEIPCQYLTFRGMGTSEPAFGTRMPGVIIQSAPGASPNNAAVFDVRFPNVGQGFTMQDLEIAGYNKALWVYKTVQVKLDNVVLSVQNTALADNSPLMLTNNFWFEWNGGSCNGTQAANKYCILATGDVPIAGEAALVGLIHIHDLQGTGNFFHYDQRVNTSGAGPGSWVFDNIRGVEGNQGPNGFFYITNSTGNSASAALPTVGDVTIANVTAADSFGPGQGILPLVEVGSSGTALFGINIDTSIAGNGGSPAIVFDGTIATGSQVLGCNIRSAGESFASAWQVVDSSGNPMPGCSIVNRNGFDFTVSDQVNFGNNRFASDINRFGGGNGPAIRLTYGNESNRFAGVALDPIQGLMVNTGNDFGFGASIGQTVRGDLDISFPPTYPPTNLTGAATTGGTISAGTYYGTVYSCTSISCNSSESAPSIQSPAVTVGGSNNAINWTWTPPIAGTGVIQAYAVSVSTTPNFNHGLWNPSQTNYQVVTGGATTKLAMTSLPTSGGPNTTVNTFAVSHRFTSNALGIDTTSPIPHTLTQNGGYICPIATKSSAYTLATGDCRVQVTGTTTITIPHTLPAAGLTSIWHVFSVSGTTTLACDSGTINGLATISVANNTGKDAYADGTNCFAQ